MEINLTLNFYNIWFIATVRDTHRTNYNFPCILEDKVPMKLKKKIVEAILFIPNLFEFFSIL